LEVEVEVEVEVEAEVEMGVLVQRGMDLGIAGLDSTADTKIHCRRKRR
jgi:hypothetical protein